MTVTELYGANNTPYDEVLIKFKDAFKYYDSEVWW